MAQSQIGKKYHLLIPRRFSLRQAIGPPQVESIVFALCSRQNHVRQGAREEKEEERGAADIVDCKLQDICRANPYWKPSVGLFTADFDELVGHQLRHEDGLRQDRQPKEAKHVAQHALEERQEVADGSEQVYPIAHAA